MLQSRITVGLQIAMILLALAILHMTGFALEHLGILSDLFAVIGAVQVGRFFINEELRYQVTDVFTQFLSIDDISERVVDIVDTIQGYYYGQAAEDELSDFVESVMFVGNEELDNNVMPQATEEEIFEEREV